MEVRLAGLVRQIARQYSTRIVKLPSNVMSDPVGANDVTREKVKKISSSMRAYIESLRKQEVEMEIERKDFELGKRHLANMMGWDPDTINQDQINKAVRYLMPSPLWDPRTRPVMLPLEEIFKRQKRAEFDSQGRPFHYLFYTAKPNQYQMLHDVYENFMICNRIEDDMLKKGVKVPPSESKINQQGSQWITRDDFSEMFAERISDADFRSIMYGLETLIEHPYSETVRDFIFKFRKVLVKVSQQMDIEPLTYTEDGRPYAKAQGKRKYCFSDVTVWGNGTGEFSINGTDILYFDEFKERHQLMMPLKFTGLLDKVDVVATVRGTGISAQAGAIRHGLSLALRSFVDEEMVNKMHIAGLLTKDRRVKERHKIGKHGARRSQTHRPR